MIYFDNAATTIPKPDKVIDSVTRAMKRFGNSSRGVYDESLEASSSVFQARKKISDLFNGYGYKQTVFSKNATEALNMAIRGLIESDFHVITSVTEHNSVLRPLNDMRVLGTGIDYIGADESGRLLLEEMEAMIGPKTRAVILNHVSNVTGNINDIKAVGDICKKRGLLFIVDASQSAGAFEIDMKDSNIDVLCFTGHKALFGPQGTGGLCVKKDIRIKPFLSGGSGVDSFNEHQPDNMPTRLEAGTLNAHGIAGLSSAIDYLHEKGIENLAKKAVDLSMIFYEEVKKLNGIKIYGDFNNKKRAAIVSLNYFDMDSSLLSQILSEEYHISTRPGAHCAPLIHKAMGTKEQGMVRFSFSHFNTVQEVEKAVKALYEITKDRRMGS